jgi:protein-S-isoprenylcysteine O-methyltransferase Ste14
MSHLLDPWHVEWCLWVLLGLVWLGGMVRSGRTVHRESLFSRATYSVVLAVGVLLLFANQRALRKLGGMPHLLAWRLWPETRAVAWGGVALVLLGVGFAVWARITLGRLWSGNVTLKEGHHLVQEGPYKFARHPIYTGFLLGLLGIAVTRGELGGFIGMVLLVTGFLRKMAIEDRLLGETFGSEYAEYRRRVPRLVPFVW